MKINQKKKHSISGYGQRLLIKMNNFGNKSESYYENEDDYINLSHKTQRIEGYKPSEAGIHILIKNKSFHERIENIKKLLND